MGYPRVLIGTAEGLDIELTEVKYLEETYLLNAVLGHA
jgi:hypothetical protein